MPTPVGDQPGRAAWRHPAWTVVDQVLSTTSNMALGILLAHSLDVRSFGAFTIVFGTYVVALGAARALGSAVLHVRFSTADPSTDPRPFRDATGVPVLVAILLFVPLLVASRVIDPEVGSPLAALAVVLPGLLLQDGWRMALLGARRPRSAAANDLVWVLVEFTVLAVVLARGRLTVTGAVFVWGLGAGAASLFGLRQTRIVPSLTGGARWVRTHRDLAPHMLGEFLLLVSVGPLTIIVLGTLVGLQDVAGLRAGELAVGPLNVLLTSLVLLGMPEASRLFATDPQRLPGALRVAAGAFAVGALVYGAIAFTLPGDLGRFLVGENWSRARPITVPLAVHFAAAGLMTGALIGLKAVEAAREAFLLRLGLTPLYLGAAVVGMLTSGAFGSATGTAAVSVLGAAIAGRRFKAVFSTATATGPTSRAGAA